MFFLTAICEFHLAGDADLSVGLGGRNESVFRYSCVQ